MRLARGRSAVRGCGGAAPSSGFSLSARSGDAVTSGKSRACRMACSRCPTLKGLRTTLVALAANQPSCSRTQLVAAVQTMTGISSVGGLILSFWSSAQPCNSVGPSIRSRTMRSGAISVTFARSSGEKLQAVIRCPRPSTMSRNRSRISSVSLTTRMCWGRDSLVVMIELPRRFDVAGGGGRPSSPLAAVECRSRARPMEGGKRPVSRPPVHPTEPAESLAIPVRLV